MTIKNSDVVVLKDSPDDGEAPSIEIEHSLTSQNLTAEAQAVTELIESQTLRELQKVQMLDFNPAEDHAILTGIINKLNTAALNLLDTDYKEIYDRKVAQYEAAATQMMETNFDKDNPELQGLHINLKPLDDENTFINEMELQRAKAVQCLLKPLAWYIVERRKLAGQLYGAASVQGRQIATTTSYKKARLTGKQLLAQLPKPSHSNLGVISEPERIVNNVFNLNAPDRSAKPATIKQEEEQSDRISDYYQDDF